MGEISTHVISKLGKPSTAGSKVVVRYNPSLTASVFDPSGWETGSEFKLSENGGIDCLVGSENMKVGLYGLEYDFSGIDEASRNLYKKEGDSYTPLNPNGCFLGPKTIFVLKVEDPKSANHVVVTVADKEISIRPGVRQH